MLYADSCVSEYNSCRNFLRMACISGMLSPEKRSEFEATDDAKLLERLTARMQASVVTESSSAAAGAVQSERTD